MSLENKQFDKDFIDQSWSKMNDLLDQEMPQRTKEDPVALLFVLLGAILLLSAYFIKSNDTIQSDLIVQSFTKDVSQKASLNLQPTFGLPQEKIINSDSQTKSSHTVFTNYDKSEENHFHSNTTVDRQAENALTSVINAKAIETTEVINPANTDLVIAGLPSKIIMLSHQNLPQQIEIDQSKEGVSEKVFLNTINFALGIHSTASSNFDYAGVGGAFDMTYSINKNLSLLSGASLSGLERTINPNDNKRNTVFINEPSGDNLGPSSHYNNLEQLIVVAIPVGFAYAFNTRFALKASANLRTTIYRDLYGYPLAIQDRRLTLDQNYNSFSINPSFGFIFNLSNSFFVDTHFEMATKSLINRDYYPSEMQRMHFMSLGLHVKL